MSGAHSKQKGAAGERALVKELTQWGFRDAHRMPQVDLAPDIKCTLPAAHLIVECKRHKKANVRAALRQVCEANADEWPGDTVIRAVYIRDDRAAPFWVLPHTSFRELIQGFGNVQTDRKSADECVACSRQCSSDPGTGATCR